MTWAVMVHGSLLTDFYDYEAAKEYATSYLFLTGEPAVILELRKSVWEQVEVIAHD